MRRFAIVALLAASCGRDKPEDKPAPPPPPKPTPAPAATPRGFARLTVKVDGKSIAMSHAFIKRVSPDQWRLSLSDRGGSCDELLRGVAGAEQGATTLAMTLRRRITPDGGDSIVVADAWTGGQQLAVTGAPVSISGPTDKGKQVDIELAKLAATGHGTSVEIQGALTAEACGDQPATDAGVPKEKHVSAASISVAGKKLDLTSAVLHGDDLVLSTGPKDCSDVWPYAQVVLERRGTGWLLSGTWFELEFEDPAPELKVTYGPQGSGKDGPTMAITLSGTSKIPPFTVTLDGTIEALDCAKRPRR